MLAAFSRKIIKSKVSNLIKFYSTTDKEQIIKLGNFDINYLKVGNGPKTVLFLPGSLSSIYIDFEHQINNLDRKKLTLVFIEPPGHGKTKPLVRKFSSKFLEEDADLAYDFMKAINIPKYSVLGYCDGGISGFIMAAKYPESVEKLLTVGSVAYLTQSDIDINESTRDLSIWTEKLKKIYFAIYDPVELQQVQNNYCDIMEQMFKNGGNMCKEYLDKIKCPTLLLHGAKDRSVSFDRVDYNLKNIKNAKLYTLEEGRHSFHKKHYEEFNDIITKFLYDEPLIYEKKEKK